MKARFTNQQPQVSVVARDGVSYVFICLNEEFKTEIYPDMGDGKTQESYYEYDYNEIVGPTDNLPLDDIQAHPENYLDYEYAEKSDDPGKKALAEIEELKAAIERGLTL